MSVLGHRSALLLAGLVACLSGCSTPGASASPLAPAQSTPMVTASDLAPSTSTPSPATAALASPDASPTDPPLLPLDLHIVPEIAGRGHGPTVASDGTEIVWPLVDKVTDAGPTVPDLAAFVPGVDEAPRIIYQLPTRDSMIWRVDVREGRYAFLEMNERKMGENGWRLWLLPREGVKAVLLDTRDGPPEDPRPAAAFALTRDGVVWTAIHDRKGVTTSELWATDADGSHPHMLLSSPVRTRQFAYPSVDPAGTSLVYSTVETAGSAHTFRIWRLDLLDPTAQPVPIGTSDDATNAVTNGSAVAWRRVDTNTAMWSPDLVVAGVDGANPSAVPTAGIVRLTLGNRFATFDSADEQVLDVYDLDRRWTMTVERYDRQSRNVIQDGWTIIAGNLLVFRRVGLEGSDAKPEIVWARLPRPGD